MNMHKRRGGRGLIISLGLIVAIGVYIVWALLRPLGSITPSALTLQQLAPTPSKLSWPNNGQAAVGIVGTSILEANGEQKSFPIASVTKVITALVVLEAKPLKLGEQGPMLTMTQDDVARYITNKANDGSGVRVEAGEQISEFQVIQALMLPSANNLSDSVAIWAYGSIESYLQAANDFLAKHDMKNTRVGVDASGLNPANTSTARDLVILGKLAMENPVLAEIVAQEKADNFPIEGTIKNVNLLLGSRNIVGIKTGNTEEAGGAYLSASRITLDEKPLTIVTAHIGAADLFSAMKNSLPLIDSAQANFEKAKLVEKNRIVGNYTAPWGATSAAITAQDLEINEWNGTSTKASAKLNDISSSTISGATVGEITIPAAGIATQQTIPVKLKDSLSPPSAWWRLTHPL